MINFFRKIRQRLLSDPPERTHSVRVGGNTGKPVLPVSGDQSFWRRPAGRYLKYGIGEIVLVVIGILIALQVNNWNEHKKSRNTEVKLLAELNGDLQATMEDLVTDADRAKKTLALTDSLFQILMVYKKEKRTEPITLPGSFIRKPNLFAKLSAYETLLNFGINNISNDSLRRDITDFYQLHLKRVKGREQFLWNHDDKELRPYLWEISEPTKSCEDCYSILDKNENGERIEYFIEKPTNKLLHLLKERYLRDYPLNLSYDATNIKIKNLIKLIDREIEAK